MPTYAYACTACDHRFEVVQSFADDSLTECPECAGRLRKVFNAVGIVFKGGGFYRTDSRSDGTGSSGTTSSTAGSSGSGSSTAGSSTTGSSGSGSSTTSGGSATPAASSTGATAGTSSSTTSA